MAPRNENRSERRRIATEREKKRIEAFNQQVERIKVRRKINLSSKILRILMEHIKSICS